MSGVVVLRGGRVLPPPGGPDGSARAAWPTAVALAGGRILEVGDDETVTAAARAVTSSGAGAVAAGPVETVELEGRLAVPGFIDAHAHPVTGGLERLRCDLSGAIALDDVLATVGRHARRLAGEGDWLLGGGWSMQTFPGGTPRAQTLDAPAGGRPAFLPNRDHHSAWVSSAALRLAGITAATPDPPGGRIERDADGTPSGTLHEAAMDLVARLVPAPTDAELDAALAEAQRHLMSLGITGWQDAILGEYPGIVDPTEAYLRAQARGRLLVRVAGALWWPRGLGEDDVAAQAAELAERARRIAAAAVGPQAAPGTGPGRRFTAPAVKIMLDGVTESFTAALHEPYRPLPGGRPLGNGLTYLDRDLLRSVVARCAGLGFGLHVHAIGDRAVTWALEAIAAVPAGAPAPAAPHQLAHLQVVRVEDVALWAASGAYANCQALWACHEPQLDELNLPFLGPERSARQYPFARLRDAGVPLAMGSDWPVSSADPLAAVHVAVNRRAPGAGGPAFLPEQALGLFEALQAYTAGSAAAAGWAGTAGELRPGLAADVAVLSSDPFDGPPERIADPVVDLTFVAGVPAWERDPGGR